MKFSWGYLKIKFSYFPGVKESKSPTGHSRSFLLRCSDSIKNRCNRNNSVDRNYRAGRLHNEYHFGVPVIS